MRGTVTFFGCLAGILAAATAPAVQTQITVHVKAKDAKFIGTGMGGAWVTMKDLKTGQMLAEGTVMGGTGDTERIIKVPMQRGKAITDDKTAKFSAIIDIDEPTQIEVTAYGPLGLKHAANRVSATQWVVPGKHINNGDAWLMEIPGFAVDILAPSDDTRLEGLPKTMQVRIHVVMMCGCSIEPGGLWDANGYEIKALLKRDGHMIEGFPLKFSGKTSEFEAPFTVEQPGAYELAVYVYDPSNGNTGIDQVSFKAAE